MLREGADDLSELKISTVNTDLSEQVLEFKIQVYLSDLQTKNTETIDINIRVGCFEETVLSITYNPSSSLDSFVSFIDNTLIL